MSRTTRIGLKCTARAISGVLAMAHHLALRAFRTIGVRKRTTTFTLRSTAGNQSHDQSGHQQHAISRYLLVAAFCAMTGCSSPETTGRVVSLVTAVNWTAVDTPSSVCSKGAHGPDDEMGTIWYTVNTRNCTELSIKQALRHQIDAGSTIELAEFHWTAPEGVSVETRLSIGNPETELAKTVLAGPYTNGESVQTITAPRTMEKNESIFWHIKADGNAQWSLVSLTTIH